MLVDEFMPVYDVSDAVATVVEADLATTWDALMNVDLVEVGRERPLVAVLGVLRMLPDVVGHLLHGELPPSQPPHMRLRDLTSLPLDKGGWILLGLREQDEIALGLIGKFWRPVIEFASVSSAERFVAFDEPGFAKTVYSLSVRPLDARRTLLSGTMRTVTTNADARRWFRRYWTFGIGSGAHLLVNGLLEVTRDHAERKIGGPTQMSGLPTAIVAPSDSTAVHGQISAGFEGVREAFAANFVSRHELGGACCVYYRGEKVVDLWGGVRNLQTGDAWEPDTMVVVHSATKGLAAMTLALAHSRGWLDYDGRVCTYWPEFAQAGKERITVRQLLAHQAGLFAINEPVDRADLVDLDRLAAILARQKPTWDAGERQAYHALTLGFYESELLRRIDPQHRSLGRFFHDEIAVPLGLDVYIGLPEDIPNSRLATMAPPGRLAMLFGFPLRFTLTAANPRSNIYRALVVNPGTAVYADEQRIYARNLEVPSGNAVGTARAIARAYGVFATGGRELGLRPETLALLAAPAIPSQHGFYDECLKGDVQFSLGFMKPSATWPFGGAASFGSPGSGGSLGFADPEMGVGYAYVTNQMGTALTGDPRDVALREALYAALRALPVRTAPVAGV